MSAALGDAEDVDGHEMGDGPAARLPAKRLQVPVFGVEAILQADGEVAAVCGVDERTFLLASVGGTISAYSASASALLYQFRAQHDEVEALYYSPALDCVVSLERDADVRYISVYHDWRGGADASTTVRGYTLPLVAEAPRVAVCNLTGRVLVAAGDVLSLWTCEDGPWEHLLEMELPLEGSVCTQLALGWPYLAISTEASIKVLYLDVHTSSDAVGSSFLPPPPLETADVSVSDGGTVEVEFDAAGQLLPPFHGALDKPPRATGASPAAAASSAASLAAAAATTAAESGSLVLSGAPAAAAAVAADALGSLASAALTTVDGVVRGVVGSAVAGMGSRDSPYGGHDSSSGVDDESLGWFRDGTHRLRLNRASGVRLGRLGCAVVLQRRVEPSSPLSVLMFMEQRDCPPLLLVASRGSGSLYRLCERGGDPTGPRVVNEFTFGADLVAAANNSLFFYALTLSGLEVWTLWNPSLDSNCLSLLLARYEQLQLPPHVHARMAAMEEFVVLLSDVFPARSSAAKSTAGGAAGFGGGFGIGAGDSGVLAALAHPRNCRLASLEFDSRLLAPSEVEAARGVVAARLETATDSAVQRRLAGKPCFTVLRQTHFAKLYPRIAAVARHCDDPVGRRMLLRYLYLLLQRRTRGLARAAGELPLDADARQRLHATLALAQHSRLLAHASGALGRELLDVDPHGAAALLAQSDVPLLKVCGLMRDWPDALGGYLERVALAEGSDIESQLCGSAALAQRLVTQLMPKPALLARLLIRYTSPWSADERAAALPVLAAAAEDSAAAQLARVLLLLREVEAEDAAALAAQLLAAMPSQQLTELLAGAPHLLLLRREGDDSVDGRGSGAVKRQQLGRLQSLLHEHARWSLLSALLRTVEKDGARSLLSQLPRALRLLAKLDEGSSGADDGSASQQLLLSVVLDHHGDALLHSSDALLRQLACSYRKAILAGKDAAYLTDDALPVELRVAHEVPAWLSQLTGGAEEAKEGESEAAALSLRALRALCASYADKHAAMLLEVVGTDLPTASSFRVLLLPALGQLRPALLELLSTEQPLRAIAAVLPLAQAHCDDTASWKQLLEDVMAAAAKATQAGDSGRVVALEAVVRSAMAWLVEELTAEELLALLPDDASIGFFLPFVEKALLRSSALAASHSLAVDALTFSFM